MDQVYSIFNLYTQADGSVLVHYETNDDDDDGYPEGVVTADYHCKNMKAALDLAGHASRFGYFGHLVDVYADGKKV